MRIFYTVIYLIVWPFFNLVHPCRAVGRENIPEGGVLVCGNHTAMSDPLFLAFAFRLEHQLRPMAKAELLQIPFIGWILRHVGVFGVERGKSDVGAIKQAMKYLKAGEKVLLYPQGHRVHESRGEQGDAKNGAAMLAVRCGVPILPVYVPERKLWFRRTTVVIGKPYMPQVSSRKGSTEEYDAITADLMARIRALGEQAA